MHKCLTSPWYQECNMVAEIPKIIEKLSIMHLYNMIHKKRYSYKFEVSDGYTLYTGCQTTRANFVTGVFKRVACSSLPWAINYWWCNDVHCLASDNHMIYQGYPLLLSYLVMCFRHLYFGATSVSTLNILR